MLSDGAISYLRPLRFDPEAERLSCMIPMGGIYWADEIPDFHALMDVQKSDRDMIFCLFRIRFKLWAGDELSKDELAYWNEAQELIPDYPVFHRVNISDADRAAQTAAEDDALAGFEALFSEADELTINEDGSFNATFDLTKDQPKSS